MELFFVTKVRINQDRAVEFVENVLRQYPINQLEDEDLPKMLAIEKRYREAKLDFTDAAIMAVSERLNVTRIAMFDRRDFTLYRPTHTDHYELLP